MKLLEHLARSSRLFTYKVAHDGGSAPNPYHGLCTLGICKPAVRRVAVPGDVVVGFDCVPDESRIIYCMVVEHVLPWPEYLAACTGKGEIPYGISADTLRKRVPRHADDPGDCIWADARHYAEALDSWSDHGGQEDFKRDVQDGENVLVSKKFWYFGKGDQHQVRLRNDDLSRLIPGRGHQSDANSPYRHAFVDFFNQELLARGISTYGRFGTPAQAPGLVDETARSRCRAQEREFDAIGEESPAKPGSVRRC